MFSALLFLLFLFLFFLNMAAFPQTLEFPKPKSYFLIHSPLSYNYSAGTRSSLLFSGLLFQHGLSCAPGDITASMGQRLPGSYSVGRRSRLLPLLSHILNRRLSVILRVDLMSFYETLWYGTINNCSCGHSILIKLKSYFRLKTQEYLAVKKHWNMQDCNITFASYEEISGHFLCSSRSHG